MLNSLSFTEIKPTTEPSSVIIFLHGLGALAQDLMSIVPNLSLPSSTYFVFPQAPQRPITINGNIVMPGWYDISEVKLNSKEDEQGILESNNLIQNLIEKMENYVSVNKIYILGFSQGGAMAIYSGITYPKKIGGIACLSGYAPLNKNLTELDHNDNSTNIFMAHGIFDTVVPMEYGKKSYQLLEKLGHNLVWHKYPMEHCVCPQQMSDLGNWLKKQFIK
ncbi:MAG: alpha/beta hydrolase [Legionellales bacterium]|nr:alpha/beta hydrolase [Legionellales bacterium]